MQGRSFAELKDDGCLLALNDAGEVFRMSVCLIYEICRSFLFRRHRIIEGVEYTSMR